MTTKTKNRIGAIGLIVLALAGSAYAAYTYWPANRGNIEQALATDLTGYNKDQVIDFIKKLDVAGATPQQITTLFDKVRTHVDKMPMGDRVALMTEGRRAFEQNPDSPLVKNTRHLMQAYWHKTLRDYVDADPEKKKKILDERINEQLAMEQMRKLRDAAGSLMGGNKNESAGAQGGPRSFSRDDMQRHIAQAMGDSMKNGTPEDRAAMTQFFQDMRARRAERGLPNPF